jgi:hypothetical protein
MKNFIIASVIILIVIFLGCEGIPTTEPVTTDPVEVSSDGLIAYYPFDGNANDSSGNSYDGVITNVTTSEGYKGQSIYFNGIDSRIDVKEAVINNGSKFTISMWIKLADNPSLSSNDCCYFLFFGGYGVWTEGNNIGLAVWSGPTNSAGGPIDHNVWTHFTGTYDGTNIRSYINGVLTETTEWLKNAQYSQGKYPITIGFSEDAFREYRLKGSLDELRIYDRVLTDGEIQKLSENKSIVANPSFNISSGTYSSPQSVVITTITSDATIRYTTDGTLPTSTYGTIYTGPVTISSTAAINAIAYKTGYTDSGVSSITINITGSGKTADFEYYQTNTDITITKYIGSNSTPSIPLTINGLPVIKIDDSAFQDNTIITSITIPSSVITLGNKVFENCSNLTSVSMASSVTATGYELFYKCANLTNVNLSTSLTAIAPWTFTDCSKLTNVVIPSSSTVIGFNSFAFSGLTSLNIPTGVKSIEGHAFQGCNALTEVSIPEGVTSIGDNVFSNCEYIISMRLPSTLSSIGEGAFFYCLKMTSITVPSSSNSFQSINGILYNKTGTTLVCYPYNKTGSSYTIPEGVTSISAYAFSYSRNITTAYFPSSLITIENDAFMNSSARDITIPANVTVIGEYAFYNLYTNITFQGTTPPTLGTKALFFNNTIYVPSASVDAYKAASSWQDYIGKITGY